MKKLFLSIIILILSFGSVYAEKSTETLKWYNLYEYRVKNVCNSYKPKNILINNPDYPELETQDFSKKDEASGDVKSTPIWNPEGNSLYVAKAQYRENMNNIYKCSILDIRKKSFLLIKEDLTKNNASLKNKIEKKIELELRKIEISKKKIKCGNNNKNKNALQKLEVLKQTSYELCRYNSYLEYLREYHKVIGNLLAADESLADTYNLSTLWNLERAKMAEIDAEIAHSYKIYPVAFHAYTEYENNLATHLLLELLKEDFMAFKKSLHKSINPLNQVIYKISNAMKK